MRRRSRTDAELARAKSRAEQGWQRRRPLTFRFLVFSSPIAAEGYQRPRLATLAQSRRPR